MNKNMNIALFCLPRNTLATSHCLDFTWTPSENLVGTEMERRIKMFTPKDTNTQGHTHLHSSTGSYALHKSHGLVSLSFLSKLN